MDEDEDEGDLNSSDQHISRAPLHLACRSTRNITPELLEELKAAFNINRTPWTKRDKRRLKKNWKRFCKYYPEYSDPKFAFSSGHDQEEQVSVQDIKAIKHRYRFELKLMQRMAYRLNDRLICDIYARCRHMFYNGSFTHRSKKFLPKELRKKIIRELEQGEVATLISNRYDVSPSVVESVRRRPKLTHTRIQWTEPMIETLDAILRNIHQGDQPPRSHIDWQKVADDMHFYGFRVNKDQCYGKWRRMMADAE